MQAYFNLPPSVLSRIDDLDQKLGPDVCPVLQSAEISARRGDFADIRAVMWDIYGTIMGLTVDDLEGALDQRAPLLAACDKTIAEFGLEAALRKLQPTGDPSQVLCDFYLDLIAQSHQRSKEQGITYPEVVIEQIWEQIWRRCQKMTPDLTAPLPRDQWCVYLGYFFDRALQRTYLNPGAAACLAHCKRLGLRQGIISNAQFYTPFHLRRLLQQSHCPSIEELFDSDLVFFSYELGCSKPNPLAFERTMDVLGQEGIKPEQVLYIGNDMLNDIWAAGQAGWKTALVACDKNQTKLRQDDPRCNQRQPDAVVFDLAELIQMLDRPTRN